MQDFDINNLSAHHTSATAALYLKKRIRSENRLRYAGIIAICFATFALVFLLWSVVSKSFGNFTKHTIMSDIYLSEEVIDPDGTRDDATIRYANYNSLILDSFIDDFPFLDSRQGRRELSALISGESAFELADTLRDNPDLIGKTIPYELLASDLTDLYYKDHYGNLETLLEGNETPLRIEGDNLNTTQSTVVVSGAEGTFNDALELAKDIQLQEAKQLIRRADRQGQAVRYIENQLSLVGDDALEILERRAAQEKLSEYILEQDRLLEQAELLQSGAEAVGGTGNLDDSTFSLFVFANGGVLKISKVSGDVLDGEVVIPLDQDRSFETSDWTMKILEQPEANRKLSDIQILLLDRMQEMGWSESSFNMRYFTASDSRDPELAGIWGGVVGTVLTMLVTMILAVPIGILSAIYLEEFAPKNRLTDIIEVTVNNLAAVPSIIFGLLGLAVFLNFFGVPRSTPLAGGIVLALMTLPTIIIASRASIRSVPPSIRDAALGLGASKVQASFHHVLPLAMPGMLTGTIIGMAQALGETAPLIIIGMVAFLVEAPQGITDSATALPVQIFRWFAFPERAFEMRTAAAILVLLFILVVMNALAVWLRKRFERRW